MNEATDDNSEERRERSRRQLYAMTSDYLQAAGEFTEATRWKAIAVEDADDTLRRIDDRMRDLKGQIELLAADFLVGDSKHVDLAGLGRVQYRDTPAGLRIADADAFMAVLGSDERALLVEQRDHLRTAEAKKYAEVVMQESGEMLVGVERTEATRSASITSNLPRKS